VSTGTYTSFKVLNEQFMGGYIETLQQNSDVFNGASRNTIQLRNKRIKGHYEYENFFQSISSLVSRRDITSVSTATDLALTQEQFIGVKLDRKIGPVGMTMDALKKIEIDQDRFSFILGQQFAKAVMVDQVNSAIRALNAALAFSGWSVDKTGESTTTMTHGYLANAIAKMGDASSRVVAWIMHSKPFWDLVGQAITDKITDVANVAIWEGRTGGINRPIIVTDDSSLLDGSTYTTLGLVEGAAVIDESEVPTVVNDLITGYENLIVRLQGELSYNLRLQGFKYDVSGGGINPIDATVATQGNWDKVVSDNRQVAGVRLLTL